MRAVQIEGRRALITGATGGIGRAIATALHERGAHVLLNGRREEVLNQLVDDLGAERCESLPADLASADEVDALLERAGRIDILVANAALPGSGRLDEYSAEEIDRALDVNLRAPIHLSRGLVPSMLERREGHLVFISSISGKVASGRGSIYAATKFGLRGFATSLHDELRDEDVGVTTVFPGFISDAGMWAETGIELRKGVTTRTPEQVAAAVVKGIETNKSEIDVAPLTLRAGGWAAGISQSAVQRLQRLGGSEELTKRMAEGQRAKR
jgi:short-subunit dehydrogenase